MAGTPVQVLRCEVVLNPAAVGREQIVNVWHIATVGATTPIAAADSFFSDINAAYTGMRTYMSKELLNTIPQMRVFNLIENKPRQPIKTYQLTQFTQAASGQAAREACICLSYRAAYVSGVSPKRRRGRIYWGPFGDALVSASTGKLNSTYKGGLVNVAQALLDASQASSLYSWVVYSPTSDPNGTGETGAHEVIEAWVDDEVDIQRRRGMPQPGAKTFVT